jgi:hypothetical protein
MGRNLLICLLGLALATPSNAFAQDCRWTFTEDTMILTRELQNRETLIRAGSFNLAGQTLLSTHDFDSKSVAMPRLSLMRHGDNGWDVELNYFGIVDWSQSATRNYAGGYISTSSPNYLLDSGIQNAAFGYESSLNSVELNLHRQFGDYVTALMGLRYVSLAESLTSYDDYDTTSVLAPRYCIRTRNDLFGFQVGGTVTMWRGKRLEINTVCKAGAFGNVATDDIDNLNPNMVPTPSSYRVHDSISRVSFLGEIGVTGVIPITERLTIRGGYQLMWLDAVATAPNQIAGNDLWLAGVATRRLGPTGAHSVNASNTLFYHGATVGLAYSF